MSTFKNRSSDDILVLLFISFFLLFHRGRSLHVRIKVVWMKFLSSGHITWFRFFNISLPLSRLLFFASKHEPLPLTILLSPFLKASAMACRVSLSSAKIILIKASIKWEWEKSRFFHRSRSEFMHWYLLQTEVKHPLSFTETKANRYSHWYVPQKVHH